LVATRQNKKQKQINLTSESQLVSFGQFPLFLLRLETGGFNSLVPFDGAVSRASSAIDGSLGFHSCLTDESTETDPRFTSQVNICDTGAVISWSRFDVLI